jgi:hypothetical protein
MLKDFFESVFLKLWAKKWICDHHELLYRYHHIGSRRVMFGTHIKQQSPYLITFDFTKKKLQIFSNLTILFAISSGLCSHLRSFLHTF